MEIYENEDSYRLRLRKRERDAMEIDKELF